MFARWFFGKEKFKFQPGYDLSFHLVEGFIKSKSSSASQLVKVETEEFINYLKLK